LPSLPLAGWRICVVVVVIAVIVTLLFLRVITAPGLALVLDLMVAAELTARVLAMAGRRPIAAR
jgi:hypothetical protein